MQCLKPQASSKKCSVNKAFTLVETLIVLAVMGLIVTFTVPKVIHEMGEAQKKAIGKETIAALHEGLYTGWQEGEITPNSSIDQVATYLAGKLNVLRHCLPGRPADDCVTSHPHAFSIHQHVLQLPSGAWISVYNIAHSHYSAFAYFIDYNGATAPNIEPSDMVVLWFNAGLQPTSAAPTRYTTPLKAGALVPDLLVNRHLVYNYWMGLD
jgi:prepilin-type N-terminal cleavage/methylation domain-containing protein